MVFYTPLVSSLLGIQTQKNENFSKLLYFPLVKNSALATAVGAVAGFFSAGLIVFFDPRINFIAGVIIGFATYQFSAFNHVFGKRRGEFEYNYRFLLLERAINKIIFREFSIFQYLRFRIDHFNSVSLYQEKICEIILSERKDFLSEEDLFVIYFKKSVLGMKNDDLGKEISMLKSAKLYNNRDLTVNFRLGLCFESLGNGDEAVQCYKTALTDPFLYSRQLKSFIESQINRVKLHGPLKKPPTLGLKYACW